jgi:hypothetical protein
MRVLFKTYGPGKTLLGKIVLRPESFEESEALRAFLEHVKSRQAGQRSYDIVFKNPDVRRIGADEVVPALRSLIGGGEQA